MLNIAKQLQNRTLHSAILALLKFMYFFLAITLQNSNTNRFMNPSGSQNKMTFNYSPPQTLKIEVFR